MLAKFKSKKQNILDSLKKQPDDYEDLSPKGALDEEIRELVTEINNLPGFVTTSSCAGRVAVYLEGQAKSQSSKKADSEQTATPEGSSSANAQGGKGGGRWLFISHQPVELESSTAPGSIFTKLGFSKTAEVAYPPADASVCFIRLKFEPMILHALAQSADHAQTMLGAGLSAGFRESGISGIVDSKGRPSTPTVAIRSSGLAMDCIIGFQAPGQQLQPMVTEQYLLTLLRVANERFRQNVERKERFWMALLEAYAGSMPTGDEYWSGYRRSGGYQTAAQLKAKKRADDMRKREEALERRAQALHRGGALDGAAERQNGGEEEQDLAFDVLTEDGDAGQ